MTFMTEALLESDSALLSQFVNGLPKTELHAHLSGSLRDSTVLELMKTHYSPEEVQIQAKLCRLSPDDLSDTRTMTECFALFKVLHKIISSPEILFRITMEVLEDLVIQDNTMYVELRTTPRGMPGVPTPEDNICTRSLDSTSFSKLNYVEIVSAAIMEFTQVVNALNITAQNSLISDNSMYIPCSAPECFTESFYYPYARSLFNKYAEASKSGKIIPFFGVGLILSVDRSQTLADANETVSIAIELSKNQSLYPIVGLDFSGNPHSGSFSQFKSCFEKARAHGLPSTIHFAETTNEEDSVAILDFAPERVGHAALMSDTVFSTLTLMSRSKNIGVEICISSNLACKLHEGISMHPFIDILRSGVVTSLCTDDKGIFGTNINKEWAHILNFPEFNHLLSPRSVDQESKNTLTTPNESKLPKSLEGSKANIIQFAVKAIELCFCNEQTKISMKKLIESKL